MTKYRVLVKSNDGNTYASKLINDQNWAYEIARIILLPCLTKNEYNLLDFYFGRCSEKVTNTYNIVWIDKVEEMIEVLGGGNPHTNP